MGHRGQLVVANPKSFGHSKKGGCLGDAGCVGRGAPNNPNNHACPYRHSPGRAEEGDPKQRRKAAQTQQPRKTKNKNLFQKEKRRAAIFFWTMGPDKGPDESTKQGQAKPSYREVLLRDKDMPKPTGRVRRYPRPPRPQRVITRLNPS